MSERPEYGSEVNWRELAEKHSAITAHMIHHEEQTLFGYDFEAEVLRRLITSSTGQRWLTTKAEAAHTLDSHRIVDRLNLESAKKEVAKAREESRQGLREHAHQIAAWVRQTVNERTVPSRYRREGALAVADWIDPEVDASPYTRADGAA
jgi:hypothetical protein